MPTFVINKGYANERTVNAERYYQSDGYFQFVDDTDDGRQILAISASDVTSVELVAE